MVSELRAFSLVVTCGARPFPRSQILVGDDVIRTFPLIQSWAASIRHTTKSCVSLELTLPIHIPHLSSFLAPLNWRLHAAPHSHDLRDQSFHSFDTSYRKVPEIVCTYTSHDFDSKLSLLFGFVYNRKSIDILLGVTSQSLKEDLQSYLFREGQDSSRNRSIYPRVK
jgi:hypothetical protein